MPFQIKIADFSAGQAPLTHLDALTQIGKAGQYSVGTNIDIISNPGKITQGPGLSTLTNGTEGGAVTELINYLTDTPPVTGVAYGIAATKIHSISSTTVLNSGGVFPHAITNATAGNSLIEFQGALYYFYNKASGADCGRYDLSSTFDDDYFSTVPTGAVALQSAPHPVAKKQDILVFGNGRYVGTFISSTTTLAPTKLDFGVGTEVPDVLFHANQWWIAVNTGISGSTTDRASASIYVWDGAALTSVLADELAVGVQKIGFLQVVNGVIYCAYQDISSSGGFTIGYISGRQIKPLRSFTGTLPTFAQKTLYKNTILFASSGLLYSCGAVVDQLPIQLSQHADGGFTTVGALAAPFGTPMVASTQSTSFKLAKFSGYDTACTWKSIVMPVVNGRMKALIDDIIVYTKALNYGASCALTLETDQATKTSSTKTIAATTGYTKTFTAAVSNTITSAGHGLSNGDYVVLTTTTTLPAGLSLATQYYVISAATDTFELSTTSGGSAVDVTDTGTGTHTWTKLGKSRHVFTKIGLRAVEDLRVSLAWSAGSTTNDCMIRSIEILGNYVEN